MHTTVDHPHELDYINRILERHPIIGQLASQDLTANDRFVNCGAEGMVTI
jgi:hypothetical protein